MEPLFLTKLEEIKDLDERLRAMVKEQWPSYPITVLPAGFAELRAAIESLRHQLRFEDKKYRDQERRQDE